MDIAIAEKLAFGATEYADYVGLRVHFGTARHRKRRIVTLIFIALAACTQTNAAHVAGQPLAIHTTCRGSGKCVFDGSDLFLTITITNQGPTPIGFPLAFRQKSGPSIRLVDLHTKVGSTLPTTLAAPDLARDFTTIAPGHSVTIAWVIKSSEIEQFAKPAIDIAAEVTIACKIQVNGKEEEFRGMDIFSISSEK